MPEPRILNVETELAPLDTVRPHPRNPRQGDIGAIHQSIEANGFYGTIVAQRSTGYILAGNHRWQALQQTGATQIPIAWIDVNDEHALRILLADNRTNDLASYDEGSLTELLQQILRDTGTLEGTGYDDEALNELVANATRDQPGNDDPNERDEAADALQEVWGTKLGQTWLIPNPNQPSHPHRLTIGDATDERTIKHLLAGGRPNIMVTDPPYGVEYDPTWRDQLAQKTGGAAMRGKVMNDDRAAWGDAYQHHPGTVAYVWHSSIHSDIVLTDLRALGYQPRAMIIWVKQSLQISRGAYNWQHEPCVYADRLHNPDALAAAHGYAGAEAEAFLAGLDAARPPLPDELDEPPDTDDENLNHETVAYAVRDGGTARWIGPASESTVWRFDNLLRANGEDKTIHGTQKPLDAFLRPIRNHAGDVFDPFAGSGTALIAAQKLGRRAYLAELDPRYAATMLERFTRAGLTPHLEP